MKIAKFATAICVGLIGLSMNATVALTKTITYDGRDIVNPQLITITQLFDNTPMQDLVGFMGQIVLHGSGPDAGKDFYAWCLDPTVFVSASGSYNALTSPLTWPDAPPLTQEQISQINSLMYFGGLELGNSTYVAAAVQLAIWQVEFGASFEFQTDTAVATLAATYVDNVTGGPWNSPGGTFTVLIPANQGESQILGYSDPFGAPLETPLPSALILFGSVLGAGYFCKRRFSNKAA